MIKKATLLKDNNKLKRKLYIWENIGIGIKATVREKEIAIKEFLEKNPDYNLYEVCSTIKLNKGTYYNFINNKVEKTIYEINDDLLKIEIVKIFEESGKRYGTNKILLALRKQKINVSERRVRRLIKELNLQKILIKKRVIVSSLPHKPTFYKNYLKRRFDIDAPNKVWVSDFLEIRICGITFYLCVVLDLFARYVVAWKLSSRKSEGLAVNTFKLAYESRNEPSDLLFHSDQGSEYTSHRFMNTLKMLGVKQSFSNPSTPYDNAVIESLYATLREEEINPHILQYENSKVIREFLTIYFDYYNNKRIHTYNGDLTPKEKEDLWFYNHNIND